MSRPIPEPFGISTKAINPPCNPRCGCLSFNPRRHVHAEPAQWGYAAILVLLAHPPATSSAIGLVVGWTFLAHFAVVLAASRGRHLSWLVFLTIGVVVIWATRHL